VATTLTAPHAQVRNQRCNRRYASSDQYESVPNRHAHPTVIATSSLLAMTDLVHVINGHMFRNITELKPSIQSKNNPTDPQVPNSLTHVNEHASAVSRTAHGRLAVQIIILTLEARSWAKST